MSKLQSVRGTKDYIFEDARIFRHIVDTAWNTAQLYNFQEVHTPIFEFTEVFKRTLGDTSDVVNKEMYSFDDRGGESLTLRPEFTAGIARAFISNGWQQHLPLKLFSAGPLFRYERPQKGRQRQFHQVNFEWLGAKEPYADAELIILAYHFLRELGLHDKVTLELNTLGDKESRENYRHALIGYLNGFKDELSEDSRARLEKNPLRVLDSKDAGDKEIVKNAPSMHDYLSEHATDFFNNVKAGLDSVNIPYRINPNIVRGLDYYSHTVFEFISHADEMGSQNTVLAGGRYDGLIGQMGGPETAAVGFASGVERLMLMCAVPILPKKLLAFLILEDDADILKYAYDLRQKGYAVELLTGKKIAKLFERADKMHASHALILGADEIKEGVIQIKNLAAKTSEKIAISELKHHVF